MSTESRTLQTWPNGSMFYIRGDVNGPPEQRSLKTRTDTRWRKGTAEEWRAIQIEVLAEMYGDRDVLCCDSSLIDDLLKVANGGELRGDLADGFEYEQIRNMYADPSDWSAEQCIDYASEHDIDLDNDPRNMTRETVIELLADISIECRDDESIDTLRAAVIANIDDDTIPGSILESWRDACREVAQDNPAEVYEWWRVSSWLCDQLHAIGEVTIDNGYGHWWGRCTTGQQWIMDGVLQRVAAQFAREDK